MSPYAVSKHAAEQYAKVYARLYGLETVCLRYFNVYGPNQRATDRYSPVVPKIVECLLERRPIPIHGTGEQTRDFTHVDNVIDANLRAASAEGVSGEVFNIGCGRSVGVLQLVRILEGLSGVDAVGFQHSASRPADMRSTLADVDKARRLLGYEPRVGLEEGLARFLEWYRGEPHRPVAAVAV
jgi:UDP-glucose 4-epimerase